jgi:hypothetical protein
MNKGKIFAAMENMKTAIDRVAASLQAGDGMTAKDVRDLAIMLAGIAEQLQEAASEEDDAPARPTMH